MENKDTHTITRPFFLLGGHDLEMLAIKEALIMEEVFEYVPLMHFGHRNENSHLLASITQFDNLNLLQVTLTREQQLIANDRNYFLKTILSLSNTTKLSCNKN